MSKIEFHLGAVAVPKTSLTGEFAMLSSHLENGGKREAVLTWKKKPELIRFTGDFHEFPGGMTEKEHWRGAKSMQGVMLNTAIAEINEEMSEKAEPYQFTPRSEKLMVLQKRHAIYAFFLVSIFMWEMDIDSIVQRHKDRLPVLIPPQDYLTNPGLIKPRPRDVAVATIYSKSYVNSLM